jgi:hypothetical protein
MPRGIPNLSSTKRSITGEIGGTTTYLVLRGTSMTHEYWREDAICEMEMASQETVFTIGVSYGPEGELQYQDTDETPGPWTEAHLRVVERYFSISKDAELFYRHKATGWHTIQKTGQRRTYNVHRRVHRSPVF